MWDEIEKLLKACHINIHAFSKIVGISDSTLRNYKYKH